MVHQRPSVIDVNVVDKKRLAVLGLVGVGTS